MCCHICLFDAHEFNFFRAGKSGVDVDPAAQLLGKKRNIILRLFRSQTLENTHVSVEPVTVAGVDNIC